MWTLKVRRGRRIRISIPGQRIPPQSLSAEPQTPSSLLQSVIGATVAVLNGVLTIEFDNLVQNIAERSRSKNVTKQDAVPGL
jgi:hypothetical protein